MILIELVVCYLFIYLPNLTYLTSKQTFRKPRRPNGYAVGAGCEGPDSMVRPIWEMNFKVA